MCASTNVHDMCVLIARLFSQHNLTFTLLDILDSRCCGWCGLVTMAPKLDTWDDFLGGLDTTPDAAIVKATTEFLFKAHYLSPKATMNVREEDLVQGVNGVDWGNNARMKSTARCALDELKTIRATQIVGTMQAATQLAPPPPNTSTQSQSPSQLWGTQSAAATAANAAGQQVARRGDSCTFDKEDDTPWDDCGGWLPSSAASSSRLPPSGAASFSHSATNVVTPHHRFARTKHVLCRHIPQIWDLTDRRMPYEVQDWEFAEAIIDNLQSQQEICEFYDQWRNEKQCDHFQGFGWCRFGSRCNFGHHGAP